MKDNSKNTELSYDDYETIRVACSFHSPCNVKNNMSDITNKLNVMHVNTRSIVNKYDDLCNLLIETATTWHIISISETWLSKSIEDNYNLPGYQAFHCSRETGAGGGAALYIANHLCPERILNPIFTTAEVVCAKVKLEENTELVICQVYRSPNTDNVFNLELEQCLIWLNKLNKIHLISGDFNFDLFSIESNTSTHTFFHYVRYIYVPGTLTRALEGGLRITPSGGGGI